VVLTVDTLRADHLRLYGYPRGTMPGIEALAAEAAVFDGAVVPRGSTRPSYASMLTGLYPFRHGVRSNGRVLHADVLTLAEVLRAAGYHTAAFVSNFVLLGEMSGLAQGFDVYDDRLGEQQHGALPGGPDGANYERTAANTAAAILRWLDAGPPEPFFLFVNFIDPHGPYRPPDRYRTLFQSDRVRLLDPSAIPPYTREPDTLNFYDYVDRYDGEIRLVDDAIAEVARTLRGRGLWDDALVVFTADHGEGFGEHAQLFEHHWHLWEETTRVPLVVRLPGRGRGAPRPRRIGGVASPLDLAPTLLSYLGLRAGADGRLDGIDLLPALRGAEPPDRAFFIEFPAAATPFMQHADVFAVRTAGRKLVRTDNPQTGEVLSQVFFDITRDPLEQGGIAYDGGDPAHRRLAVELDEMVREVRSTVLPFPVVEYEMPLPERPAFVRSRGAQPGRGRVTRSLMPAQVEALRALGYVEGHAGGGEAPRIDGSVGKEK
jgi:arylsulfatase A-like enzyme